MICKLIWLRPSVRCITFRATFKRKQPVATPNYGYEKRQKELAKKRKKEDKLKRKAEGKPDEPEDGEEGEGGEPTPDGQAGVSPVA